MIKQNIKSNKKTIDWEIDKEKFHLMNVILDNRFPFYFILTNQKNKQTINIKGVTYNS